MAETPTPMVRRIPKTVVICGSSKFVDVMAVCAWLIERDEFAIVTGIHLLPVWYTKGRNDHIPEHEGVEPVIDDLADRKIEWADEVFVVNRYGYIGATTERQLRYAAGIEKPIRYYRSDPIGRKVEKIIEIFLGEMNKAQSRIIRPN